MSRTTLSMTPLLYDYLLGHSLREDPLLAQLRHETAKMSTGKMQIAPEQGQFMAFLVQLLGAKKTLDIGVFTGYSALVVAKALPPKSKVIACDINIEWTKIARKYWQLAGQDQKIELRLAPAVDTLNQLLKNGEGETYDFIFIDADKQNYENYYELALQLVRKGGVIAIDNVLWGGRVSDLSENDENTLAIRNLNNKIVTDSRVNLTMIPIADGLSLVRKL
jgi:predicted O-methyltransferase YrrM